MAEHLAADDYDFMARALRLAERGLFTTSPNPRVGSVVVADGRVIGEGWHERAGQPHAEVLALREAGERARGATLFVTLEPCSHHGRTPPCSDAVIASGVARVVVAMQDPNPLVAGRGLGQLRQAGIEVLVGPLAEQARELNVGFVSRMNRGRPWVRVKLAASLDGKTALNNGKSQWITGGAARRDGHHWRARACAILTGIGTVRDDDPQLSVRDVATTRQPLRVVVDSRLEISPQARILQGGNVLVAAALEDEARASLLRDQGAEIVALPNPGGKVELPGLLSELGRRGIGELHVEAGFKLAGSLMREDLVDELLIYLAPCLIGDAGRGMFNLPELVDLSGRRELELRDIRMIGNDLRILARPKGL